MTQIQNCEKSFFQCQKLVFLSFKFLSMLVFSLSQFFLAVLTKIKTQLGKNIHQLSVERTTRHPGYWIFPFEQERYSPSQTDKVSFTIFQTVPQNRPAQTATCIKQPPVISIHAVQSHPKQFWIVLHLVILKFPNEKFPWNIFLTFP